MEKRERRWWLLLIAPAGIAVVILAWPRNDQYAFLRKLHPSDRVQRVEAPGFFLRVQPPTSWRRFDFTVSPEEVVTCLSAKGNFYSIGGLVPAKSVIQMARSKSFPAEGLGFKSPMGQPGTFSPAAQPPDATCTLTMYDEKQSWFDRQLQTLRRWLGVRS